ncbi:carboxypeptidase regulatory-like domain-containing protein [Candidatus Woesearchaeota archaeon]|nr:carboxypeptidase regulatory-like domain-containing protein [Candidatus Woesearchaeota archaeon]
MKKIQKLLFLLLLFEILSVNAQLDCKVKDSDYCGINEVKFLGLYSGENSHASLQEYELPKSICCSGLKDLNSSTGTPFLWLSGKYNAHVQTYNNANYADAARISASNNIDCVHSDSSCLAGYTCLASISSPSNAHIGDCDSYDLKVCCKEGCPQGTYLDKLLECKNASSCNLNEENYCLTGNRCTCHSDGACYWYPDSSCSYPEDTQCNNACSPSGSRKCSGVAGYQICSDYNYDGCLEWNTIPCGAGYECLDGNCVCSANLYKRNCKKYSESDWTSMCNKLYPVEWKNKIINYYGTCHTTTEPAGGDYTACEIDITDTQCCTNTDECVYGNECYIGGHTEDIDKDGFIEVCVAHSEGEWVEASDEICDNGIDDDYDGIIDCDDPDCNGKITGYVFDENNQPLAEGKVEVFKESSLIASDDYTESDGSYEINNVSCGTIDLITSKGDYVPKTKTINLQPKTAIQVNFNLIYGLVCEADCTYLLDERCHKGCAGFADKAGNECRFFDDTAKNKCDMSKKGWVVDYNATQKIECCDGEPFTTAKTKVVPSCPKGKNLIKNIRISKYKGKPIQIVTAICS